MSAVATVENVLATESFGRCDACGDAAALARVMVATGTLDFCRRCLLKHADALKATIVDVALSEAAAEIKLTDDYVCTLLGVTR
jgi:hypothetical protein